MREPRFLVLSVCLAIVFFTGSALGQDLFIYPQRGQTQEQQNRDRYECHSWAVQQTGFDPTRAQTAQAPPPSASGAPQGDVVRGAGRGAALGAVGGAIGGDAGKGAAIGAATGALFGGEQEQAAWAAQQQSAAAQGHNAYNRAMTACLSGRGYTVQ
jgi:hypothetical protein